MLFKIKRFLFILKGKIIGFNPASEKEFERYEKYIIKHIKK
jgi:hypothetical protein